MIDCLEKLYTSQISKVTEERVRAALRDKTELPDLYLITFSTNGVDQLDLLSAKSFEKERQRNLAMTVVGLCESEDEGVELIARIAGEAMREAGHCRLQEYLLSGQRGRGA